jgi:c-di-GMP-binding flagellar brake protein YcgR
LLPMVNQNLLLQVKSIDEEEAKIEYKSRITDVTDEGIVMEVPVHERSGQLKKLYMGDEISACFENEGGVKNYFNTSVVGLKEDVIQLVVIKKPDPEAITKIQRRRFVRVPAELEIAVKFSNQLQFVAITGDIGGGGISFICDGYIPLSFKYTISCWLLVPFKAGTIEHIPLKGEIVRVKVLETGKQLAKLRFVDITESDRQKLIRFCFERQMDFRKK